jgi:hypothetical protein
VIDAGSEGQPAESPDDIQGADTVLLETLETPPRDLSYGAAEMSEPDSTSPDDYYLVKKGDSLGSILRTLQEAGLATTWDDLLSLNPELDSARLKVGQKLSLPTRAP